MISQDDKNHIRQLIKSHKLQHKNDIFNMMNDGATLPEIEEFIAKLIAEQESQRKHQIIAHENPANFKIFGHSLISRNALDDMNSIMQLPYVMGGALMPDAHRVKEAHVPVGGVVVSDMLIPGVVGSDIACSVFLSVTSQPVDDDWFHDAIPSLKYVLRHYSYFGQELNPNPAVFSQAFFNEEPGLETALGKEIFEQVKLASRNDFGTSGDGNHFLEIGTANVQGSDFHNTGKKRYLAILSHFGSRTVGRTIANAFSDAALELYQMPKGMSDAPLDPSTGLGRDYWKLMNWAGNFAESGHRWLHQHILEQISLRKTLAYSDTFSIYTKHNFAWETEFGYVHRKGATPAEFGQYGVIPATMADETQIVVGLGNENSFSSTSHGAGRRYSRGNALQQFGNDNTAEFLLKKHGIHLLGGGADEDPRAYKDIHEVMQAQADCASSLGNFKAVVVRMADPRFQWR